MLLSELIEHLKSELQEQGDFVLVREYGPLLVSIKSVELVKVQTDAERDQAAKLVIECNDP